MQICVAYLVCEKREEEDEFFFQWLASERRLVVDTKKKYLSLVRTPRVRSLSSARVTRTRLSNTFFVKVSPQLRVSVAQKSHYHHRRKELARGRRKRDTKKQREKNTNTIYDIKYAAIFHVQNDVRFPRRHFSFHRHLTRVRSRPGRRREHFTFHFLLSFNVCLYGVF